MISRIKNSEFFSNSLILITGTFLAQLIPILLQPALRRLFEPSDFGYFAIYSTIIGMFISISNLKYENAIVVAKTDKNADNLLSGGVLISLIFSVLIGLVMFIFKDLWVDYFNLSKSISWFFWFIPISIFVLSSYQCMNYWFIRQKKFKLSSTNKLVRRGGEGIGQLGFGLGRYSGGLIIGSVIGDLSNFFAGLYQSRRLGFNWKSFNIKEIKKVLIEYKKFPLFNAIPSFLNTFSLMFPVIIVNALYGEATTGQFDLSRVVLALPLALISVSISQVYFQRLSEQIRIKKRITGEFRKMALILALISIPGATIGYFLCEPIFELFFGNNWGLASRITQILIFAYAIKFVVSPLSVSIIALEKLKWSAAWQIVYFISIICLFLLKECSIEEFFIYYASLEIIIYLAYFLLTMYLVHNHDKSLNQ